MTRGKVVATNKKAYHDYFIDETYEAGITLQGSEVKSIRAGRVSIKESFAGVKDGEVFLYNMHVAPYEYGRLSEQDPRRTRKLLLHKSEIGRLIGKIKERGYALVPLKVYFSGQVVKIELGLARGKKLYDKRRAIAERTARREIERAVKEKQKSR
ncbi:MAG: SsrA-binding protein SmpB [Actinomycetota bacterium]|nr:SsrA-binding protein SmpB [Actinomycetota bacterium]